jgi:RNA polymerase-binding transcription factor DksA
MNSNFEKYRQRLLSLRDCAMGTVGHVAEAIREHVNPSGTVSGAPVHLADAAEVTVESNAEVLQMEGNLLEHIELALNRINEGTYDRCEDCGVRIPRGRLDVIPFTSYCVECANRRDQAGDRAVLPIRKLSSRRAGQFVDELAPGQSNPRGSEDRFAAGTPGGGLAAGGLGGSNVGHGEPTPDLQDAFGSGTVDDTRDDESEPQAGAHGGAVGGTPAGKRAKPR